MVFVLTGAGTCSSLRDHAKLTAQADRTKITQFAVSVALSSSLVPVINEQNFQSTSECLIVCYKVYCTAYRSIEIDFTVPFNSCQAWFVSVGHCRNL